MKPSVAFGSLALLGLVIVGFFSGRYGLLRFDKWEAKPAIEVMPSMVVLPREALSSTKTLRIKLRNLSGQNVNVLGIRQVCSCIKVRGIPVTLLPNDVAAVEIETDFSNVAEAMAQSDKPILTAESPLEMPIYLDVVSAPVAIRICAGSK